MSIAIVITGAPCAGKSTLAVALAARLRWPLLAKDDYKERTFDHLGSGDRAWSRRVSGLAWALLLEEAGRLFAAGVNCVLEGNARAEVREALAAHALEERVALLEIRVHARPEVLRSRYLARARAGVRHPGHVDLEALADVEREFTAAGPVPPLLGRCLAWDTSAGIDEAALWPALQPLLPLSAPARGTRD